MWSTYAGLLVCLLLLVFLHFPSVRTVLVAAGTVRVTATLVGMFFCEKMMAKQKCWSKSILKNLALLR